MFCSFWKGSVCPTLRMKSFWFFKKPPCEAESNAAKWLKRAGITLRELILTGTNFGEFGEFGEFRQNSPKLVPTEIKDFAHSQKKSLAKIKFSDILPK